MKELKIVLFFKKEESDTKLGHDLFWIAISYIQSDEKNWIIYEAKMNKKEINNLRTNQDKNPLVGKKCWQ